MTKGKVVIVVRVNDVKVGQSDSFEIDTKENFDLAMEQARECVQGADILPEEKRLKDPFLCNDSNIDTVSFDVVRPTKPALKGERAQVYVALGIIDSGGKRELFSHRLRTAFSPARIAEADALVEEPSANCAVASALASDIVRAFCALENNIKELFVQLLSRD